LARGELGEFSDNYKFSLAEAKRLTAAAGFANAIDLPFYVNTQGTIPEENQLVIDALKQSGVFNLQVVQMSANDFRTNINVDGKYDGTQQESAASGNDIDYVLYRDYHSSRVGGVAFPDPKIDALAEAQRREADYEKRIAIIKDIQKYLAQNMLMNPGRSLYTRFSFRWPWVHNLNYGGETTGVARNPDLGGYLQWLDANMPNRDRLT
jgi:ABC-type transport system substrate-binding protein